MSWWKKLLVGAAEGAIESQIGRFTNSELEEKSRYELIDVIKRLEAEIEDLKRKK